MKIESVFLNLVDAGMMAKKMDKAMQDAGFDDNPYFEIYGCVAQAIYYLLDEKMDNYEDSLADYSLSDKLHGREERVSFLMDAYNKASS